MDKFQTYPDLIISKNSNFGIHIWSQKTAKYVLNEKHSAPYVKITFVFELR